MVRAGKLSFCAAILCLVGRAEDSTSDKFYAAIRGGNLSNLNSLLDQGAKVDAADTRGVTPLMNAAAVGSLEAMKRLLNHKAAVNLQNDFGSTALMWAAGDTEKI